jgi:GDP-L-fucose synthase
MAFEIAGKRIWVAGHGGMVGSALLRQLSREQCEVLTVGREETDLTRQSAVEDYLSATKPDAIIIAAALAGGILANDVRSAEFLAQNLAIATNVITAAHAADVGRLVFLGSSCIYPRLAPQPIEESALLTGALEPTNQWYAIAKIAGLKLVEAHRRQYGRDYISVMPTNLYGPGDRFDLLSGHIIPALMRKAHEAKRRGQKTITVWGTGSPRREFLHVDDCADAITFLLQNYSGAEHVNVGSGTDMTILALARLICEVVGFEGEIEHDLTKPDGTPAKLMSGEKLRNMGWRPSIDLREGLKATYAWFTQNVAVPA